MFVHFVGGWFVFVKALRMPGNSCFMLLSLLNGSSIIILVGILINFLTGSAMRWIFLILLTINLGVILWYTQIGVHQEKAQIPTIPKDVKRLVLLSEHRAENQADLASEQDISNPKPMGNSIQADNVEPDKLVLPEIDIVNAKPKIEKPEISSFIACYTIGPFKEAARLDETKKQLSAIGVSLKQRTNIESELYGYRVYIPPLSSREEAVKITKELASHKIDDYFIIQDAEKRHGISLGLFRNKSGAIRRMAQVRRFGFKPMMEVRNREREIFWLDLEQKEDLLSDAVWREVSEGQPELQRLERECNG